MTFRFFRKIRENVRNSWCTAAAGVVDAGGKLVTAVVVDTGEKIIAGVVDNGGHIFSDIYIDRGEISRTFSDGVNDAIRQFADGI